jgi:tetratricopeptide (TPR) repeat protein
MEYYSIWREGSGLSLDAGGHLQNGRYSLLKKLGEGGKGVVFKAQDTALNRVVAVKVLKGAAMTGEAYSRFISEAQATAKLDHPNIVSIHDIGREGEQQFFVIEFIDGMSLRGLMEASPQGQCDVQTVLRIGMDVCNALRYAHSQGVLHRDIKPENIMITKDGITKLMDFGLAKMLGQPSYTQEGMIVGTVAYVAPEIALGKGADARSDLYSLGAVLYEMVTGRQPFLGEDPVKVLFGHIHDYPISPTKLNPKVPQPLVDCIMRLLEKDPASRYQSASDLLEVLRGIAESSLKEAIEPQHEPGVIVPSPRPLTTGEVQLIDRVEELSILMKAVDGAVRGEGGLVLLYGEAGIGKTRLAREIETYAHLRGMQALYGRCPALFTMGSVPPYALWSEAIKNYLEVCTPQQLYRVVGTYPSEVGKLVPHIKQRLGAFQELAPINPEHERDRLFEAVSQFITNISREAPLLVVLDDLQWTDQSSLLLLQYVARDIKKESLLLLGEYRDTNVDERHLLFPILAELNREHLPQLIHLKRMSMDEIAEMIKQILGQEVPRDFCELVYEKTRGNPFFTEEVIKALKEEEIIYCEGGKWKIKEVSRIEFPPTIKSVIENRIGRLDGECRNVLTMASFIGKDFTFEALRKVTNIEEDNLLKIVEKILDTGLIKEKLIRGEEVYSFADIIVRDVVHEEVSLLRHKRLHGTIGSTLEGLYSNKVDEHLGELAYQFLEGGNESKALEYFLKAGERAEKVYAHGEATSYLQSALELLERKGERLRQRASVLERLGDIKRLVGEYGDCMKYWDEALSSWAQLQEKERIAGVHRKMASVLWDNVGYVERAKEHHTEALKILEIEPKSIELASLYEDMANMYSMTGDTAKALSWAEKGLDLAKELNALEVVASSYVTLGSLERAIAGKAEDYEKAQEYLLKALKIALDNNYIETALGAYINLGGWIPLEDFNTAPRYHEKGYELAKKVGAIRYQSLFAISMAGMYFGMGDFSKEVALGEESLALDRKAGNMPQLYSSLILMANNYEILGELDKSEQLLKEAFEISKSLGDTQSLLYAGPYIGMYYFQRGDYVKAREILEKTQEALEKGGYKYYPIALGSEYLIRTYIELGEIEKARKLIDNMHEFAMQVRWKYAIALADALRGVQFRAEKKWQESIDQFEKSLQEFEEINCRQMSAHGFAYRLVEYSRVYQERDQKGDRERAYKLLDEALGIFQKMGAKGEIEKIIAKKKLLTA